MAWVLGTKSSRFPAIWAGAAAQLPDRWPQVDFRAATHAARCAAHPWIWGFANRRLNQSPIDALIYIKIGEIGGRLFCKIPMRLDVHPVIAVRVAVIPQRWPACRTNVRGLGLHPDVLQYLPDLRSLGDERNQAHLPTTKRAHSGKTS